MLKYTLSRAPGNKERTSDERNGFIVREISLSGAQPDKLLGNGSPRSRRFIPKKLVGLGAGHKSSRTMNPFLSSEVRSLFPGARDKVYFNIAETCLIPQSTTSSPFRRPDWARNTWCC